MKEIIKNNKKAIMFIITLWLSVISKIRVDHIKTVNSRICKNTPDCLIGDVIKEIHEVININSHF